jgi:hypothetical protein
VHSLLVHIMHHAQGQWHSKRNTWKLSTVATLSERPTSARMCVLRGADLTVPGTAVVADPGLVLVLVLPPSPAHAHTRRTMHKEVCSCAWSAQMRHPCLVCRRDMKHGVDDDRTTTAYSKRQDSA